MSPPYIVGVDANAVTIETTLGRVEVPRSGVILHGGFRHQGGELVTECLSVLAVHAIEGLFDELDQEEPQ